MISKKEFNKWAAGIADACYLAMGEDRFLAAFVHLNQPHEEWVKVCRISPDKKADNTWRKEVRQFLLSNTNILCELHNRI